MKRRYRKSHASEEPSSSMEEDASNTQLDVQYKTEVLGVVERTYRFTGIIGGKGVLKCFLLGMCRWENVN